MSRWTESAWAQGINEGKDWLNNECRLTGEADVEFLRTESEEDDTELYWRTQKRWDNEMDTRYVSGWLSWARANSLLWIVIESQ